jgi:hypothetical protein
MFEPDVLSRLNVTNNALVFVTTDHGFLLGHDPSARPKTGVVVAHLRSDDRDRMVYDQLDRPTTYWYKLEADGPHLVPWAPYPFEDPYRFEMEAEWPALSQINGYAAPGFTDPCAGVGAQVLVVTPVPASARAIVTVSIPVPSTGRYGVVPRIVHGTTLPYSDAPAASHGAVRIGDAVWTSRSVPGGGCQELGVHDLTLTAPSAIVTIEAQGGAFAVDRITLKRRQ